MIYLLHPSGTIACCETEASAARLETRGYVRMGRELYMAYWRRKDRRARAAMDREDRAAAPLQERVVGGDAPGLPGGWKRYYVEESK